MNMFKIHQTDMKSFLFLFFLWMDKQNNLEKTQYSHLSVFQLDSELLSWFEIIMVLRILSKK